METTRPDRDANSERKTEWAVELTTNRGVAVNLGNQSLDDAAARFEYWRCQHLMSSEAPEPRLLRRTVTVSRTEWEQVDPAVIREKTS